MNKPTLPNRTEKITFAVTRELKIMLEAEAYEEQRSLSEYIYRLLLTRGKFARTVGSAGGYMIGPAEVPKQEGDA
jgi:hypothetical protein